MFLTLHQIAGDPILDINFDKVFSFHQPKGDKRTLITPDEYDNPNISVKETPEEIRKMLNADPIKVGLKKLGVDIDLPDVDTNEL